MITSHQLSSFTIDDIEVPKNLTDLLLSELFALPSKRKVINRSLPDIQIDASADEPGFTIVVPPSVNVLTDVIKPVFDHADAGNAIKFSGEDRPLYMFSVDNGAHVCYLSIDTENTEEFSFPDDICLRKLTPVTMSDGVPA